MPQKRFLTKKGVVSSPTAVHMSPVKMSNANAPPAVLTASRVTRIPIPKGTKVPVSVVKSSKQPNIVTTTTAATPTTTDTTASPVTPTVTSTTSSLADWAIDFQVQLRAMNSRFVAYETRLNEVERLTAKNSKLKSALSEANQLIATLRAEVKQLSHSSTPRDAAMSDVPAVVSDSAASGAASSVSNSFFAATTAPATTTPAASLSKPSIEFTVVKRKRNKSKKPAPPPSPAALAAFSHKFSPPSDPSSSNGYRFVYYKASKHPLSWYRSKMLPMIGVNDSRVLDIHFPTQRVAAFLLHSDFILDFTSIVHQKLNLDPLLDFDPLEDRNLLDPAFAFLDPVSRSQKLHDLQNLRVLRALTFVRTSVRVSVAKSMLLQNSITQAQFDAILADTLAARAAQTPVPTASAAERKEKNRIRVEFPFNLNYLDPLSAMTVASTPPPDLPAADNAHASDPLNGMQD